MTTPATTEIGNRIADGILANLQAKGEKPSRTFARVIELLRQATESDVDELLDHMRLRALMDPDTEPEYRRELLSRYERCPCCDRWLGHNRPPADAYNEPDYTRRQTSFDFKR
jgi:hypothetical protein